MFQAIVGCIVLLVIWCQAAVAEVALAKLDIKEPVIPPSRGVAKGTLTIAQHFGLSPTWFDPQEQGVGGIGQAFAALVHDALIKPTGQGYYTYSLAEHLEMPADYPYNATCPSGLLKGCPPVVSDAPDTPCDCAVACASPLVTLLPG